MKIAKQYSQEYIQCLPKELEKSIINEIKKAISELALSDIEKADAIENAYNEKVCNLTDTITLEFI